MDIKSISDSIRPKHQMKAPGLGIFIAPKGVARLFQLHGYSKCPSFRAKRETVELIPLLLPNVYNSSRFQKVRRKVK